MDYSKIAQRLKFIRERKGLNYEQIFEVTRIQPSILRDIEEGKSSLPPVFLKGFIKTYARFLGVDVEDIFKSLEQDDLHLDKTNKQRAEHEKEPLHAHGFFKYVWPFIIGLFIIISAIFFRQSFFDTSKKNKKITSPLTLNTKHFPMTQKREETTEISLPYLRGETHLKKELTLFQQIKTSMFLEEVLIKSSKPLEIYFKIDDKFTFTQLLQKNTWFFIKAKKSIYLRFDENQGYVQIFYNGKNVNFGNTEFFEKTFPFPEQTTHNILRTLNGS